MADTELQRHIKENLQKKRDEERRIQALKRQGEQEQKNANAEPKWKAVKDLAEKMIESGYQGFDNWTSAYSQIVNVCLKLNEAISASDLGGRVVGAIFDKTFRPLLHKLEDKFGNKMPDFKVQGVEFTDDNKLDLNGLNVTASDGTILPPGTDEIFKRGVISWLQTNGYQQSRDEANVFVDRNGHRLTKDGFQELLNDGEIGLANYLGQRHEVNVEYNSPRPSL